MIPFNYRKFNYKGISFPSETPFFPTVISVGDDDAVVSFNQGYVFNFNEILPIKVIGMDELKTVVKGDKFYVKLTIEKKSTPNSSNEEINIVVTAELFKTNANLTKVENIVYIKVCEFGDQGEIIDIYLRENIYWNINKSERLIHCWRVTQTPNKDGFFDISGGVVYGKGGFIDVPNDEQRQVADNHFIYLKINTSGLGDIASVQIQSGATIPANTSTEIYREIAKISPNGEEILQLAFEPIRLNDGDTFIVQILPSVISAYGDSYYYYSMPIEIIVTNGEPTATFYVQRGLWHTTQPVGFPEGAPIYQVTYNMPTVPVEEPPP
jgi:hypothetical protein